MARTDRRRIEDVQPESGGDGRSFAEEQKAVVVLKGYQTVIAAPGRAVLLNKSGNPGMAAAGSGDVLARDDRFADRPGNGTSPGGRCAASICMVWRGIGPRPGCPSTRCSPPI